ncbi:uncharacterized protein GJ701_007784 isoform 2-T3 [Geothlypis trichas]
MSASPGLFYIFIITCKSGITLSGGSPIWLSAAFSWLQWPYPAPAASVQDLLVQQCQHPPILADTSDTEARRRQVSFPLRKRCGNVLAAEVALTSRRKLNSPAESVTSATQSKYEHISLGSSPSPQHHIYETVSLSTSSNMTEITPMEKRKEAFWMHSLLAPRGLHHTGVQKLEHKLCLPAGSQLFSSPARKKTTCIMKAPAQLVSLWTEGPAMGQGSIYTKHRRHVGAGNTRGCCCPVWTPWCLDK